MCWVVSGSRSAVPLVSTSSAPGPWSPGPVPLSPSGGASFLHSLLVRQEPAHDSPNGRHSMRAIVDKLISLTGLALVVVLLGAGGLLTWANVFIGDQVNQQLTMQGITMPEGEALASLPKADATALKQFGGSALDTGPEARAYADHYILAHMNAASQGRTYEEVSGEFLALDDAAKATADGQALAGLRQTLFMGNTLRGLLLYGFAFATIGTIAGYAAIAAFIAAVALLALVLLGLRHAKMTATQHDLPTVKAEPALA